MSKAPAKAHAADHGPHDEDHGHGGGGGHDDHGGGGHCPPPWIITFADMATLLMAFFVIMLMTATTDQPKFNAFAAVMRQTFGRVPLDPNNADKGGTSIIDLHFGPQSGEQTNDPPATTPQSGDPDIPDSGKAEGVGNPGGGTGEGASDATGSGGNPADEAAKALAKAMQDAVANGELSVESDAGAVTIRLPKGASKEDAQKIADALSAGADAANAASPAKAPGEGAPAAGEATGAPAQGDATGAPATGEGTGANGQGTGAAAGDAGGGAPAAGSGVGMIRAKMAAVKLGMALQEQMASGEVQVEQRDGAVVVTVGAGGAFASGSADMTEQAKAIIAQLEDVSGKAQRIVVTGHTDNVPLTGSTFTDNWGLASARANSVVRSITESGAMPDTELVAVSKGESEPIADNATPEGRQKNRRIEIEIEFDQE